MPPYAMNVLKCNVAHLASIGAIIAYQPVLLNCKNCGASLPFGNTSTVVVCCRCGSQFLLGQISDEVHDVGSMLTLIDFVTKSQANLFVEKQKEDLVKKIAFLEEQYKETSHPSILIKIQKTKSKLNNLTAKGVSNESITSG